MLPRVAFLLLIFSLAPSALAHEGHADHEPETCLIGLLCGQAAVIGSWVLILLGLLLWLAGLLPYRTQEETAEGKGMGTALSLFRGLQARTGQEAVGWRRLPWPILGLALVGLGTATLFGWW